MTLLLLSCSTSSTPGDTSGIQTDSAPVERTGPWMSVSSTLLGNCALREDGSAACWGDDSKGQLEVPEDTYRSVATGPRTACGVTSSGDLTCWGDSLGEVPEGDFVDVAVSSLHACALDVSGAVSCWGEPGRVDVPEGSFRQISTGWAAFTCAVDDVGALHCWGDSPPAPPEGAFDSVDVGQRHACAVTVDGAASCWGNDDEGQLGVIDADWQHVTAGSFHSCGLTNGLALCWGAEGQTNFGQVPASAEAFESLDAGGWHNCGVTPTGELACWGDDHAGQSTPPSD